MAQLLYGELGRGGVGQAAGGPGLGNESRVGARDASAGEGGWSQPHRKEVEKRLQADAMNAIDLKISKLLKLVVKKPVETGKEQHAREQFKELQSNLRDPELVTLLGDVFKAVTEAIAVAVSFP